MNAFEIEEKIALFARELGFMSVGLIDISYGSNCARLFIAASGSTAIVIFRPDSESPDAFLADFIRNLGKHHQLVHVISSVRSGRRAIQGIL
ncbi:hypothetical protein [Thiolapillus sp.]|uniref:hypothetical protein n=1 Tax=Thiolapillus sp. TaxID=2017437 RepID=UPI003AF46925